MSQKYLPSILFYFALLSIYGAKADIQCYECAWTNPPTQGSVSSCKSAPTSLQSYPSPIQGPDSIKAASSTKILQTITDTILASHGSINNRSIDAALSPNGAEETQAVYTVLCVTMALRLRVDKESGEIIIREGYPLRVPETFNGKCLNSYPPLLEDMLGPNIAYITASTFCYCDTNGCNKDAIDIPGSGVKPTFSAIPLFLSLFLLKFSF